MAKSKGIQQRLLEEVQPQVAELQSQIQALRKEAEQKVAGVERFRAQIEEKEAEAQRLRDEAGRCLSTGDDPMPLLEQAVQIEGQAQAMQELLPQGEARPDAAERQEIERLKRRMNSEIRKALNNSSVIEEVEAEFNRQLQDLKQLFDSWCEAQDAVGKTYGTTERAKLLKAESWQLQQFAQNIIGNISGPFL